MTTKLLGHRAYGHIAHLPGSRQTPGDKTLHPGQARICCEKARDKHDVITVQEKEHAMQAQLFDREAITGDDVSEVLNEGRYWQRVFPVAEKLCDIVEALVAERETDKQRIDELQAELAHGASFNPCQSCAADRP